MPIPKISVCIPAYNHGKYIGDTIKSVLEQSFQDFEIIISDDNSPDNTVEVAKSFSDARIKIIANKINQGPSINSNVAIQNSSTDFIALIASDDTMKKNRLEETFNFLTKTPNLDAVFTYAQTIDQNNQEINHPMMDVFNKSFTQKYNILNPYSVLNYFFYNGNFMCAPSFLIKKSVLIELGCFKPCLWQLQDFDLWLRMLIEGFNIGCIAEKLTNYRIHGTNISFDGGTSAKSRMYFEVEKTLDNFLAISDIEALTKILPSLKDKYSIVESKFIPFFLMKEALDLSKANPQSFYHLIYKNFAVNVAYKLLNQDHLRDKIYQNFNFGMKDFLEMISNNPLIQ